MVGEKRFDISPHFFKIVTVQKAMPTRAHSWTFCCMEGDLAPPYVFREALIRGNTIRSIENALDPDTQVLGIRLHSTENGTASHNVIRLNRGTPLLHDFSKIINYFNNQKPEGTLIQGTYATQYPLIRSPLTSPRPT